MPQHILNKNPVSFCRVLHKHVRHGADKFTVLDNWRTTHGYVKTGVKTFFHFFKCPFAPLITNPKNKKPSTYLSKASPLYHIYRLCFIMRSGYALLFSASSLTFSNGRPVYCAIFSRETCPSLIISSTI